YQAFVTALGRRLAKGPKLRQEISEDIDRVDDKAMPSPAGS
ncbi:CopG family transcriptional regulator, partial [Mesorhizobium sp. M2D.F.Ca.ET.178.01.1.1]